MRRNILRIVVWLLLFEVSAFGSVVGRARAESATFVVPDDFSTIQEAINNAVDGDTVFVKAGTYYEHVTINKTLSLLGEDASTAIIDGSNTGHVISIVSDNVTLANFTVQRGGGIMFPDYDAGISLKNARGCEISGNNIVDNGCFGIHLLESNQNTVSGNNFMRNAWYAIDLTTSNSNIVSSNTVVFNGNIGIGMHYSSQNNIILENTILNNTYGLDVARASNNTILGNYLADNSETGIWIQDYAINNTIFGNNVTASRYCVKIEGQANSNTVSGNVLSGSQFGIRILNAQSNRVVDNTIVDNDCGLYTEYSIGNLVYKNSLVSNDQQVSVQSGSVNNWNSSYPIGGNYWSDYVSPDLFSGPYQNVTGGDGIGDNPYVIDVDNRDNYPFMLLSVCNVSQVPQGGMISPADEARITATITHLYSVEQAMLNYTITNSTGTFHLSLDMTKAEGDVWNATIPASPLGTNVTYIIIGQDSEGSTVNSQQQGYTLEYQVTPEFSSIFILAPLAIVTLLIAIVSKHMTGKSSKVERRA